MITMRGFGVQVEPPPVSRPVADLDREIGQLQSELARETDVEKASLLLGRVEVLRRRREALLLTESNTAQQQEEAEAAAQARRDRAAGRQRLGVSLAALRELPQDLFVVSESGIRGAADVLRLRDAGARGILVGESLMRAPDVGEAVRELLREVRPSPDPAG